MHNDELEFDCLNKGDIFAVSQLLHKNCFSDSAILVCGYYGRAIFNDFSGVPVDFCEPSEFCRHKDCHDTIVITNPEIIKTVFSDQDSVKSIVKQVRNQFIFMFPFFCNSSANENVSLFLYEGFSYVEEDSGEYSCWFADHNSHCGRIILYNHTQSPNLIRLQFSIFSLDPMSLVRISVPHTGYSRTYMEQYFNFDKEFYLNPGYNYVNIEHNGYILRNKEGDIRPLQFRISALTLQFHQQNGCLSELSGNSIFKHRVNSAFYEYCINSISVLAYLHSSGFFEIDSYVSYKNAGVLFDKTTRSFLDAELYRTKNKETEQHSMNYGDVGLAIFTAKRKGVLCQ